MTTVPQEAGEKDRLLFCEKTCSRCRETKSADQFGKSAASKDGLQSNCKDCNREWYRKNKERHLAVARRAYARRMGKEAPAGSLPPLDSEPFVDGVKRPKKEVVTYYAAHRRLYSRRGAPSGYSCVDCGTTAKHWALRVDDVSPDQRLVSPQGYVYALDADLYDPECIRCHFQGDAPTHCKHGHEFTEENTYVRKDTGHRMCRTCTRDRYLARKAAR